jgi:hypothetical protein
MIRRAASRSACPVRPANTPPRSVADPDVEFCKRIAEQVERLREAVAWNEGLAEEFDNLVEPKVEIMRVAFDDKTISHEVLRAMISELMK